MSTTMIHVKEKQRHDALDRLAALLGGTDGVSSVTPRQAGVLLVKFDPQVIQLRSLLDRASGSGVSVEFIDL